MQKVQNMHAFLRQGKVPLFMRVYMLGVFFSLLESWLVPLFLSSVWCFRIGYRPKQNDATFNEMTSPLFVLNGKLNMH